MALADDPDLALPVGGRSVGANLDQAVADGRIVAHADGTFEVAQPAKPDEAGGTPFINKPGDFDRPCVFLNDFMFKNAYAEAAVPFGCRNCYKVKVVSGSLRQLMAVHDIAQSLPQTSKSGVDANNPFNPHVYSTYFYNIGLDRARALYKLLRSQFDNSKVLASGVRLLIKRGCSNYERKCGPSDRYTFDPRLENVEASLFARYRKYRPSEHKDYNRKAEDAARLMQMVRIAYRLGDETYKDFTAGKDLLPPSVTYPAD